MARRASDSLEALVVYDRIDLSVEESPLLGEGKIDAPCPRYSVGSNLHVSAPSLPQPQCDACWALRFGRA
jgi:hypothetical protein